MAFHLTYKPFGERAILVEWPPEIDENILKDVILFKAAIEDKNDTHIVEIRCAYNSLLVVYDSLYMDFLNEVETLKTYYFSKKSTPNSVSRLWKIPVCYDAVFGSDLEAISTEKKLAKEVIVARHSQAIYTVYFIGFLPGFLYLGGLDESLFMPRKATPRLQIIKGAVAIGGNQTGIYPMASPGGWNIIGNSPIAFFKPKSNSPCFAKPLDKIEFVPVSISKYKDIKLLVEADVYQLESEVCHG